MYDTVCHVYTNIKLSKLFYCHLHSLKRLDSQSAMEIERKAEIKRDHMYTLILTYVQWTCCDVWRKQENKVKFVLKLLLQAQQRSCIQCATECLERIYTNMQNLNAQLNHCHAHHLSFWRTRKKHSQLTHTHTHSWHI